MLDKRCSAYSTLIRLGHRSCKILHSMKYVFCCLMGSQVLNSEKVQAMQKMQTQQPTGSGTGSDASTPQSQSPNPQQQQAIYSMANMGNPAALYSAMSPGMAATMTPAMLQMQMQMGMMGSPFGIPQTQAMHQNVMRHPSPGPTGGQNYMNMGGVQF